MCEMKTVLVSVCLILLVTASFCLCWIYPEKKLGQYSEIKIRNPCENEYKRYWLNGGGSYYIIDEKTVDGNCTWLCGGKLCEKYIWWTQRDMEKTLFSPNCTRFKVFNSKSDTL